MDIHWTKVEWVESKYQFQRFFLFFKSFDRARKKLKKDDLSCRDSKCCITINHQTSNAFMEMMRFRICVDFLGSGSENLTS